MPTNDLGDRLIGAFVSMTQQMDSGEFLPPEDMGTSAWVAIEELAELAEALDTERITVFLMALLVGLTLGQEGVTVAQLFEKEDDRERRQS